VSPAAVTALGLGQLVNWGVLYYAFAILLQPVQEELQTPAWLVTGAFSLGLLVSALLAPAVGRWSDRGHAPFAIAAGGLAGAVLLGLWALVPGVVTLYVVWAGLGVCMAAALYEPAFAIVIRSQASADERLRTLAVVTLFGGLASTVFLPLTAGLVAVAGWRGAVGALAALLVVSTAVTFVGLGRPRTTTASETAPPAPSHQSGLRAEATASLGFLTLVFAVASLASASFIANLVPALGERGLPAATAALLGGLFGVMQLPGRALMVSRRLNLSGRALLAISLALQAVGLIGVSAVPTTAAVALGVMTFAAGAGLTTLARPYLVQTAFAIDQAGLVNGRLARAQQLTRAAGPVAASSAASLTSHATVLVVFGVCLAVLAWLVGRRR
jgi:MFS family permease